MTSPDEHLALVKLLAKQIKPQLPADVGFCLMIVPIGTNPEERVQYISDCDRAGVRTMMRNMVEKWDTDENFVLKRPKS